MNELVYVVDTTTYEDVKSGGEPLRGVIVYGGFKEREVASQYQDYQNGKVYTLPTMERESEVVTAMELYILAVQDTEVENAVRTHLQTPIEGLLTG